MINNTILACPYCNSSLEELSEGLKCVDCGEIFEVNKANQIDLRLKKTKKYNINFNIGAQELLYTYKNKIKLLKKNPNSPNNILNKNIPYHLTKEILTYFPSPKSRNSIMLDLGSGHGVHREICESIGFNYIGIDYKTPEADILADVHALPFKDNSFEFVLSIAALEHIQYPFIMMREVRRILSPGGVFIGSVSFLEPFHEDSFYHHTYLGVLNTLVSANFDIEFVSPNESWNGITAIAQMALFPMLPGFISRLIVFPLNLLHILWWKTGKIISGNIKANKLNRLLLTTGSFYFMAIKKQEDF